EATHTLTQRAPSSHRRLRGCKALAASCGRSPIVTFTDRMVAGVASAHDAFSRHMRALPHTLRDVPAEEGAVLQVVIPGFGGWACTRGPERWTLSRETRA